MIYFCVCSIQDSEKEATKQRISELEEMVIQLRDELKEKVTTQLCFYFTVWWHALLYLGANSPALGGGGGGGGGGAKKPPPPPPPPPAA